MSGGGGGTQTIEKADPWAGQQPHLMNTMGNAADFFYNNPSSYYPGQTYLPRNQYQQEGMDAQLGNVGDLYGISGQAQGGLNALFNASDPNSEQNLKFSQALEQRLQGMLGTSLGQLQRNFGYQGEDLGLQAGNLIGQQSRAYDAQSARSIDDIAAMRERQMRDYDVSRNMLTEDLQKQLPYLASDANLAGQAGSTRQGIAEGLALQNAQNRLSEFGRSQDETLASNMRSAGIGFGDLARSQSESLGQSVLGGVLGMNQLGREQAGQYGSAATNLTNQANLSLADFMSQQYGQGLDATKAGLLASPTAAGLSQMPYQSLYQVGDMVRNQDMLPLQEQMDRYYYNQQAPWNDLNQYASIVQGIPAGLGTSTSTGPSGSSLGSAIGGGLAGAGAAQSLGLIGGAAGLSNPLGWGLIGLGALGGYL